MTATNTTRLFSSLGLAILLATGLTSTARATVEDFGYGFYRTVEGEALLTTLDDDAEALEIEPNYPVLVGDRLWVAAGSRVEAVLPDKSVLRLDEGTEVFFESLAGSADGDEGTATVLHLMEGELQLVAEAYVLSDEPIRIDTANSRVFLQAPGTYRLATDGRGWTEVVVRGGFAEVNTERGSMVVRDGESALVEGEYRPEVSIAAAGSFDELERWGAELSGQTLAGVEYLDESLTYAAAPLERHGYWVSTSGRWAWRPTVRVGWRPFIDGWWVHTPSGLSWVAYEPWGWVTSHYGAWDYVPGYGWLWYPGSVYSPAWVYWYWGPTHTAWIPAGYYTRFYGPRYGWDFRFGVYGWAGGYWDSWAYWTFCPTRYFGRRNYRSHWRSGHEMHRDRRLRAVPRGIITTDTRDITPGRWGKPTEILGALERRHAAGTRSARALGDVSTFIERRAELPDETRRVVGRGSDAPRLDAAGSSRDPRRKAARIQDTETPWRIERPDAVRSPSTRRPEAPAARLRGPEGEDQWSLIERLRRFEAKKQDQAMPRSPRSVRPEGSDATRIRGLAPSGGETPTRRILDGVRHRSPEAAGGEARSPSTFRREIGTSSGRSRSVAPPAAPRRPGPVASPRSSGGSRSMTPARPQSNAKPQSSKGSSGSGKAGSVSRSRPRKPN